MRLHSADGQFTLDLVLLPELGPPHRGWHSYEFHLKSNAGDLSFRSSEDDPLFLDCSLDPEIPTLCDGIQNAIDTQGVFVFTPIDDRDFEFAFDATGTRPTVRLEFLQGPTGLEFGWHSGVTVEEEELLHFASGLSAEFAHVLGK